MILQTDHLTSYDRLQLLRDFPLYCHKVHFRGDETSENDKLHLSLFRSDNQNLQESIDSVLGIILEQDKYRKNPLSDAELSNLLTKFFWECKEVLPQDVFGIIERVFEIEYFYPKTENSYLEQYLEGIQSRLPVNSLPLTETSVAIRKQIRQKNFGQNQEVHLLFPVLEEQIRHEHNLIHDEYVPIAEAIFDAIQKRSLQLLNIEGGALIFTGIPYAHNYPHYDKDEKILHIDEDRRYEVKKSEGDAFILEQLFYGDKELGEDWAYDDLKEKWESDEEASKLIDREKDVMKFFKRAVYNLVKRIEEQEKEAQIIIKKPNRFKVNIPS